MAAVQTAFEAGTHATFEALMWAFSYPGQTRRLEGKFAAIADALLDLETSAFTDDVALETKLRATGAKLKALEDAEYVFLPELTDLELLRSAQRGSTLYPDRAATLIIGAKLDTGTPLRLTGPGIQTALEVQTNLPLEFWRVRDEVIAYPIGWDVLIVDGLKILGLPRTTRIEVK
jgi:alpha-D-ribose 1-methylphosphonate 5-triphosphate synthase subunit PhnH